MTMFQSSVILSTYYPSITNTMAKRQFQSSVILSTYYPVDAGTIKKK